MYSVSCLVVSGADDCWAAGVMSGSLVVYATTSGGSTWSAQSVSPSGTVTNPSISCEVGSSVGTCMVVTGANALATTDGGATWGATSLSPISSPTLDAVSCPTVSTCFATDNGTGIAELSGGSSFIGTGASTWSALTLGLSINSLAGISCASASVCTTGGMQDATDTHGSGSDIGYQGTVLSTSNGGANWTSSLTNGDPPTNLLPNALLVHGPNYFSCPTSAACLAGGEEGIVASRNDNVAPWTGAFLTPVMAGTQLSCATLSACFMAPGSDVTFRSPGGGRSWYPENLPTIESNSSTSGISGPTNNVYDSGCNGTSLCGFLGKTTDGYYDQGWSSDGQTWTTQADDATSGSDSFQALSCLTSGYCIYFDNNSSSSTLDHLGPCTGTGTCPTLTTPTGITKTFASSCEGSADCWVVGQNTSGDGAVWATTNGGVTWTLQSLPSPLSGTGAFTQSSLSCADTQDCVVANASGNFAYTTTGGTGWSTLSTASVNAETTVSCADANDCEAIVGTTSSGIEILALTYAGTSWSPTLNALPAGYTTASSMTCADSSDCWVLAGTTSGTTAVLSANVQVPPVGGALTQGESFAGNAAESKGQSPQAWTSGVNTADGDYSTSFPLVSIPARGLPFGFSLTYDAQLAQYQVESGASSAGPYGWGWTASNNESVTAGPGASQVTVNQEGGAQVVYNETTPGGVPTYTPAESARVETILTYSSSTNQYTFTFDNGLEKDFFTTSGPLAAGTLVSEKDANGYAITYGSEAKNLGLCPNTSGVTNCSTIVDPAGRTITIVNATSGFVSEVIDPAGNTWALVDTSGNLTSIEDPRSHSTSFAYDNGNTNANLVHDLVQITPPRNVGNTLIAYDSLGRVYCQVAPAEQAASVTCPGVGSPATFGMTVYQYSGSNSSDSGGTTTITDPHGNITNHEYSNNVLVATTSGIGTATPASTVIQPDSNSLQAARVIDPDGHVTTTLYDINGNPTSVTDGLGHSTTTSYNTFNEPLTVTDPKGIITAYTYDANGNQLTKTVSAPGTDTGPPGWTKATVESGVKIQGISCPSATLCVGTDHSGNVLWSTNPIGGVTAWSKFNVNSHSLNGVSCPSTGLCVAVGAAGQVVTASTNPTGGSSAWSSRTADGTTAINAISCPSATLCVAADNAGHILYNTNPAGSTTWTKTHIDGTANVLSISCATPSQCVATDENGNVLTTSAPTGTATAWTKTNIDGSANITSASCPSAALCVVSDVNGDVLTTTSPTGGSWTKYDIDGSTVINSVSCASVSMCVATDAAGTVFTATSPTGGVSAWSKDTVDGSTALDAVSCPTVTVCVAGDASGNVVMSPDAGGVPSWAKATVDSGVKIQGVSCPSATLCVGTDHSGNVLWSTNPTGGVGTWSKANVNSNSLNGISCPSTSLCVAVGASGQTVTASTNPIGGSSAWSSTSADGTTTLNAVSCPSISLCVASDAAGNILYNTNPAGSTWTSTHIDGTTNISSISCATTTQCVATDADGNVLTTSSPTGSASAWTTTDIDGTANITSASCPSTSLCVVSDVSGDVLTTTSPTGGSWTKYDIDGSTAIDSVNCGSVSLCVASDAAGTIFTTTNPTGGLSAWSKADVDGSTALDAVSCPTVIVCAAGDASGNVVTSADAGGIVTSTTTNTYGDSNPGELTAVTDPDGHVTTYNYDTYGDVVTTSVTVGSQTEKTSDSYDNLGQKYCEISPNANALSVACAAMGSHNSNTTTWNYDSDGNVLTTFDANGNETLYQYDADNNVTLITDGLTNETQTNYDADDRVTSVVAGYGSTSAATTTYTYDVAASSCSSAPTETTFCDQVQNGLSKTTTTYYNALSQMIENSPPDVIDQLPTLYTYDGVGNVLTKTDGSGTTIYTYDADNRLIGITYTNTTSGYVQPNAVTYQYDADGNRTQMGDGTGTTSYTYDPLNRLESVTNGNSDTVTYGYDPAGNTMCLSYPNSGSISCQNALSGTGLVTYSYDNANRVSSMADWINPATPTVFSYDANSNLTGTTYPTSTAFVVTNGFDNTDSLTSVSGVSTLTRNADKKIATTTPPGESTVTYGYDPLNRVTAGPTPFDATGATKGYTYDAASEVSSVTPSGGSALDYSYNPDGQLCWTGSTTGTCTSPPSGSTTYTYSTVGERVTSTAPSATTETYQWDQAGNLMCITPSGTSCLSPVFGETSNYKYNGDGLRMSDIPASTRSTEHFTWDVSSSVPRLLEDVGEYYLYGPNIGSAPIEQIKISDGTHTYLVSDPTGVREQINSAGAKVGSTSYDAFGNPCSTCSIATVFGFEGGYTDETGFIYLDHRYDDPSTGQFLSVDPAVAKTLQPYVYAEDDPVNAADPSGEISAADFLGWVAQQSHLTQEFFGCIAKFGVQNCETFFNAVSSQNSAKSSSHSAGSSQKSGGCPSSPLAVVGCYHLGQDVANATGCLARGAVAGLWSRKLIQPAEGIFGRLQALAKIAVDDEPVGWIIVGASAAAGCAFSGVPRP